MKKTILKLLSLCLCVVLIAAMALMTSGCDNKNPPETVSSAIDDTASKSDVTTVGEGNTTFDFTVKDQAGKETKFVVLTDKTTVGEALLDAKLIAGEDSQYGLYVKTVNGITLDYETDGMYWAFYVNGEYAMSGVDTTEIKTGETYTFKAEK